jgi:hypothetical protein
MITRPLLKQLLHYDPSTGLFTWRVSKPPRAKAGALAGYDNGSGYIKISIGGKRYYAHRLAFLWMTGEAPDEIDHINQCRTDNRWANLRAAEHRANSANVRGRSGVRQRYGRWYARFGKAHLGVFGTEPEAREARRFAEVAAARLDPNKYHAPVDLTKRPKREHRAFQHEGKNLSEWSRITGIPQPTLHHRIFAQGLEPEKALSKRKTTDVAEVARARRAGRRSVETWWHLSD